MFKNQNNILGFLQKKSFFEVQQNTSKKLNRHQLSPDIISRFQNRSKSPEFYKTPPKTLTKTKINYQDTEEISKSPNNKTIKDIQKQAKIKQLLKAESEQYPVTRKHSPRNFNKIFEEKSKFEYQRSKKNLSESIFVTGTSSKKIQEFISTNNENFKASLQKHKQFLIEAKHKIAENKSRFRLDSQQITNKVYFERSQPRKNKHSNKNFETSKIESKLCIEDMQKQVEKQMQAIQSIIGQLTVHFEEQLFSKLTKIKTEISKLIEELFFEAKSNLEQILESTKTQHLRQILTIKYKLKEKDYQLKQLKREMDQNWRKATGQILANQIDRHIEEVLDESVKIRQKITHQRLYEQEKQITLKGSKSKAINNSQSFENLKQIVVSLIKKSI